MTTRLKRRIALAKDLILFGIGSGGITYQIATDGANIAILTTCLILVGLGSLGGLTSIARGTPIELQQPQSTVDSSASTSDSSSTT